MADFVLVHGAWHGAWCWKRIEFIPTPKMVVMQPIKARVRAQLHRLPLAYKPTP
jgi:hypothetical protein